VRQQGLPVELIITDDCSSDDTLNIATAFAAKVLHGPLALLDARIKGTLAASTEVVVFLDSDQILRPGALVRSLEMLNSFDSLVLEERSTPTTNWISALFAADRRLLHHLSDHHLKPGTGSLLPRVFKKAVLAPALESIPAHIRQLVVAQDHAIIWDAVAKRSDSVGIVPDAVLHEDMQTLREVVRKYFRWGVRLPALFEAAPEYRELTQRAVQGRLKREDAPWGDYLRSMALLGIKTVPYGLGFVYGKALQRHGDGPNRS
jgi:glycosyltransferase involved in cell wall biosynthesis